MGKEYVFYTDGSARNNGRDDCICAYAWLCTTTGDYDSGICSVNNKSSNNIAELMAIRMALLYAQEKEIKNILLYTDSQYAIGVLTTHTAQRNNGLIYNIKEIISSFNNIEFIWVKAHNYNTFNEQVDKLANEAFGAGAACHLEINNAPSNQLSLF